LKTELNLQAQVVSAPAGPAQRAIRLAAPSPAVNKYQNLFGYSPSPRLISTANCMGRPLHPILIMLPIGLFVGTFIFDLVFWQTANEVSREALFGCLALA
jgi:hypothetical protein